MPPAQVTAWSARSSTATTRLPRSKFARVGDAFRLDFERIRLLDPDLVLAWRSGTSAQVLGRLESLGYRVVVLETGTVDAIAAELLRLGSLAGSEPAARIAATDLLAARDRLRSDYAGRPVVRVFFQLSGEPYFSISADHVISDVIRTVRRGQYFRGPARHCIAGRHRVGGDGRSRCDSGRS